MLITGAHPEYHTKTMLNTVRDYADNGGQIMYLGANGFYWVVATHNNLPGVIEVRRFGDATKTWVADPGEFHCSLSGEYGSLWRHNGRTPQSLVGIGFTSEGFDMSTYYKRQPGSRDSRAELALGTPPHSLILATAENFSDLYYVTQEETPLNAPGSSGNHPLNRADMTFFETPHGGAVFSVGSIAYVGSICWNRFDNNIAKLTENVLRRFLDETPFEIPDSTAPSPQTRRLD